VSAGLESLSSYRGNGSSEVRAEVHVVGNWSDMQMTEGISFHLDYW
jgi:hypothetical protein